MSDPTDIRAAIVDRLTSSSELLSLLPNGEAGVCHRSGRKGLEFPIAVYFRDPVDQYVFSFGGEALVDGRWVVKGVGPTKQAETIDRLCKSLLTDFEFSINGTDVLYFKPDSTIDYVEVLDSRTIDHIGTRYRLVTI